MLGAASAAGLGLVDVVFALRGRIAKVYLLDAAIEGAVVIGWVRTCIHKRAARRERTTPRA